MLTFLESTRYQSWVSKLRYAWNGTNAKRIMGGFAAVLGDKAIDWGTKMLLEHLSQFATPPAQARLASDWRLDPGPHESSNTLGNQLVGAVQQWRLAGTPLGLLVALFYAEFGSAIIVQQNGRIYSLSGPIIPGQDPSVTESVSDAMLLGVPLTSDITLGRSIPAGTPWWMFDSNTDFCSRFAVLFTDTPPSSFTTWARATFTSGGPLTVPLVWNNPFPDTTYIIIPGPIVLTGGTGSVDVDFDNSTKTTLGVTARASSGFDGYVDFLAYQIGANPFADPHPSDLQRLRSVIAKWKPQKATCVGIYCAVQGGFWGLKESTWGDGENWGPHTVVSFSA